MEYFKLTRKLECHGGLLLRDGLVVDTQAWSDAMCVSGGIHFCKREHVVHWVNLYPDIEWIRTVTLPTDAKVAHGDIKSKADRVVLGPRTPLREWVAAQPVAFQVTIAELHPMLMTWPLTVLRAVIGSRGYGLQLVDEQTPDLCCLAIERNALQLEFVKEQTPELCMFAVSRNGHALRFVRVQTPELREAAVKQTPSALQHCNVCPPELYMTAVTSRATALKLVPREKQTHAMRLAAVQRDGVALQYVDALDRTPDIRMAAVQQTGYAIAYMNAEEQTEELAMAAVQTTGVALMFVRKPTPAIRLAAVRNDAAAMLYIHAADVTDDIRAVVRSV